MSTRIVAAVPYQRGHSESRSKSKSEKRAGISDNITTKTISTEIAPSYVKGLMGNFGPTNNLIGGIHIPLGVSSSHNLVAGKPNEF